MASESTAEPKLRHDPPDVPGYRLEDRPAIPIGRLNLLALPLAIPFGLFFIIVGLLLQPGAPPAFQFTLGNILLILALLLLGVPIAHEAVHGIVAKILGARPVFGVGQGFAYTSFLEPVSPRQYRLITAAPLIGISLVCIAMFPMFPEWFSYILMFAVANSVGAIGDLWILRRIRHLPSDAIIYDLADGYAAFVLDGSSDAGSK